MTKKIIILTIIMTMIFTPLVSHKSQAANTISIGDYIQFGSYYNEPILWRVINIDEDGDPLLFSEYIISIKSFDSAGENHYNNNLQNSYNRTKGGSNLWLYSNIGQWLNSSETKITWLQNPPSRKNLYNGQNPYDQEKGFLADGNFTEDERRVIKEVTHKSILAETDKNLRDGGTEVYLNLSPLTGLGNYNQAYYHDITEQVFLLDAKELREYVYDNGFDVKARPTQKAVDNSEYKGNLIDGYLTPSEYWYYWLRTPNANHVNDVNYVSSYENRVLNYSASYDRNGIRPALYLNLKSINYTGSGTKNNPYVIDTTEIKEEYIVTLDPQGGVVKPSTLTREYNATYGTLPIPTKSGYIFEGWYLNPDGIGEEIKNSTKVTIKKNHTLYAQWSIEPKEDEYEDIGSKVITDKAYEWTIEFSHDIDYKTANSTNIYVIDELGNILDFVKPVIQNGKFVKLQLLYNEVYEFNHYYTIIIEKGIKSEAGIELTSGVKMEFVVEGEETPVIITESYKNISAGYDNTVALKEDGTVWVWGGNTFGQLGNGENIGSNTPVESIGLDNVVSVASGWSSTAVLKSDGTVWTMGYNSYGQLGDGTNKSSNIPVQVKGLSDIVSISAGWEHMVALKSDGTVWTWGNNKYGALGDGTNYDSSIPVKVDGIENVIYISAGGASTAVVKSDGTVWGWGDNILGQLGDGTKNDRNTPVKAKNLSNIISVSMGSGHMMALMDDGTLWATGYNGYGQLGDGTYNSKDIFVEVIGLENIVSVAVGHDHTVALKEDGTVMAWGRNDKGYLGDGTTIDSLVPVQVMGLDQIIEISAGDYHTVALREDGTVWAWGSNSYGKLGNGRNDEYITYPFRVFINLW